jgi:hypothetical protein
MVVDSVGSGRSHEDDDLAGQPTCGGPSVEGGQVGEIHPLRDVDD